MDAPRPATVTLLTDFGTADDFAGVCEAVIVARCPGAQVVHLTHGITPQHVVQGAIVLRDTLPYTPVGVHMAVVDPGVGTSRRGVAVVAADGRRFVGPDNGLLVPAIGAAGGAAAAVAIESPDVLLHPVSDTFHARDVFSPAAAHLAGGGELADLGPAIDTGSLVAIELPQPQLADGELAAEAWNIDRFGNVALALTRTALEELLGGSSKAEIEVRADRFYAHYGSTFGSVRPGELVLYEDSYGHISVAVNRGDAAGTFSMRIGDTITIRPADDHVEEAATPARRALAPRGR